MTDVFTKARRSEVMTRIRSRGNKDTELALVKMLRAHGITGWRRQVRVAVEGRRSSVEGKKVQKPTSPRPSPRSGEGVARSGSRRSTFVSRLTVRPDFVFRKARTAVFVDGCFWHGCPKHATQPKHNAAFWLAKLNGNRTRDALVTRTLRRAGWRVVRVWEHELAKRSETRLLRRIQRALGCPNFTNRAAVTTR